ncbi:aldo/keto reductase [Mycolicibacterium setense]|uniref:aldo/keto reductase n=1 Tax=Mycolicibacterium setense TaxID=431269 RepID=UPI000A5993B4|nr:aldo/keto reductase [Mycolicibacterium setense]
MVSALGVGCLPMSGVYGQSPDVDGIATFHRAIDLGISLFDTADIYGLGHNEGLVGRALRGRRDKVILATKVGGLMAEASNAGQGMSPGSGSGWATGFDGRPEYVKRACDASLRRLGIETIDLYQLHRVDPRTPIEDTVGALAELVEVGKVRFIGLCEVLPSDLRRAAAVYPITSLQSEYSLIEREIEREMLGVCEELDVGFLAYAPLGRGLLGGSLTPNSELHVGDIRRSAQLPRVSSEHLADNVSLARIVAEIAAGYNATPAQVALAWLLGRRPWIVPIPGTERIPYLEENVLALDLDLTDGDHELLDSLAAKVRGPRYSAEIAAQADVASPT